MARPVPDTPPSATTRCVVSLLVLAVLLGGGTLALRSKTRRHRAVSDLLALVQDQIPESQRILSMVEETIRSPDADPHRRAMERSGILSATGILDESLQTIAGADPEGIFRASAEDRIGKASEALERLRKEAPILIGAIRMAMTTQDARAEMARSGVEVTLGLARLRDVLKEESRVGHEAILEAQMALLLGGLVTIIVIGIFVLRPFTSRMERQMSELRFLLQATDDRARSRSIKLKKVNATLRSEMADRLAAEEAAQQSEERWHKLVRNLADTVIEVDREGTVLYINRTPRDGEVTQIVGEKVYDCIADEHHGRVRQALRTVFTTGNEVSYEAKAQCPENGVSWHAARLGPVREDGDIVAATIVSRDITSMKKAEEARQESENKFRNLVESMTDVVWEVDREGRFTYCSPNAERITGYTVEELEARSILELLPGKDALPLFEGAPPSTFLLAHEIRTRQGERKTLEVSGSPVETRSGGFKGYRGSIRDITDRAEVERSLRRTLEQIDLLLKQRQVLLWTTDRNLCFTSLIGSGLAQVSFGRNEVIGKSLSEYFQREDPDFPPIAAHRRSMEGEVCQYEVAWGERVYQCRVEPHLDDDGNVTGTIGVALDVTEFRAAEDALRRSEAELRQSQKMEAIGRLAGGVAHDFNNLLTAITGYSDLILQQIEEDGDLRADIGEIKKAASRASTLTRQLLAFSRKQVLRPRPVDMNAVIRDMESMLRRVIGEDIVLETLLSETPSTIEADPGQIEQVVVNLAVNAREAMAGGGRLTLATEKVDLGEPTTVGTATLEPGRYLRLSMTDTGCGMDEETLRSCFEPFFTTKEMGTGMGLSTVYGIVSQSGGAVSVTSQPSEGTRVEILFARREDAAASPPVQEPEEAPRGGTETILLVEDEGAVRILVEKVLRKQGYDVLVAGHAGEALVVSEKHPGPIDLLLSDVVMPQMSGPELAQRLTPLRPQMRVLFMSGYTDDFLARTGALDHGAGFIQKPFKPADIVCKVREVLEADHPVAKPAPAL